MGNVSKYRPSLAAEICERLSNGETLRAICRDDHMPDERSVRRWVLDDIEGFAPHYTQARDLGLDAMSDELIEIADTPEEGIRVEESERGTKTISGDMTQHRHLRVETRKWYLSKMAPKRYGVKTTTELTGADGAPLFKDEDDRARRVAALRERMENRIAQNNSAEPTDASDLA